MSARVILLAATVALCAGCSSDSPTSSGAPDTAPPTVVGVTPQDVYHFTVTFDETLSKPSAENPDNYLLVAQGYSMMMAGVPGDTMRVVPVLSPDHKTVAVSVYPAMVNLTMGLTVSGLSDTRGNRMENSSTKTFESGTSADLTPPQIFAVSPGDRTATAPVGAPVVIQFSEPVDENSFRRGVSWQSYSSGEVDYHLDVDGCKFTLTPAHLLEYDDGQTIRMAGVRDLVGNGMQTTVVMFVTTHVVDTTPPTIVSTSPKDHALNVKTISNISITFSEPINQYRFALGIHPPLAADWVWSADGRTFTLYPWSNLAENRQYTISVYPSGVLDLAGNTVAEPTSLVFTTGAALENGSIGGTIWGHPFTAAENPEGAIVVAGWNVPFAYTAVTANRTYQLTLLDDGPYGLFAFKDTNGDGNPIGDGDAVGAYGADPRFGDYDWDTFELTGGGHLGGMDFPLFDPSFITGTVTYDAYPSDYSRVHVGLFAAAGFDLSASLPVAVTDLESSYNADWSFNNIDDRFPDGQYYVAAYVDRNANGRFDIANDPVGMYGGIASPTAVSAFNGTDLLGANFEILEPAPAVSASAGQPWPPRTSAGAFREFCNRIHGVGSAVVASARGARELQSTAGTKR